MNTPFILCAGLLACAIAHAQPVPSPSGDDTWSNAPTASDDRFTNPKSKLYAGPNGWHNFGEVRAEVAGQAGKRYGFKSGLNYLETPKAFIFATNSQLQLASVEFGTPKPTPGVYDVVAKANAAQKKAAVSFMDSAGGTLLGWESSDKAGTVTVSQANGYLYIKARGLRLVSVGAGNKGDLKQPLVLGFEGAVAPQ